MIALEHSWPEITLPCDTQQLSMATRNTSAISLACGVGDENKWKKLGVLEAIIIDNIDTRYCTGMPIYEVGFAPMVRMAMARRVHPLVSLKPYQGIWTIRVTQIQATMFNEAARKFYEKFQLGKVYYISSGTLNVAN
ncbi:hypothetical protein V6N13_035685 [Hibiscus sabdariffa]